MTLKADVFPKLRTPKHMIKQISKKSGFRGYFDKEHGKVDQKMVKSEPHHLYHIYLWLWRHLGWKKFLLLVWKILGMFLKALNAGRKYSLLNRGNLKKPIRMQLSQKQKLISEFAFAFLTPKLNFKDFQIKMTMIAEAFPKLWTPKNVVKKCLKSPVSEDPSTSNMVRVTRQCWNLKPALPCLLSRKRSLLVVCKILGLFVEILNAGHKYSLLYRENIKKPIQMRLFQKQK